MSQPRITKTLTERALAASTEMTPKPTLEKEPQFYISFNGYDTALAGTTTTALVVGDKMDAFYILNGDHRRQYAVLSKSGLDSCITYFTEHADAKNKYSDDLPPLRGLST